MTSCRSHRLLLLFAAPLCLVAGCRTSAPGPAPGSPLPGEEPSAGTSRTYPAKPAPAPAEPVAVKANLAPERRALLVENGQERWVDADAAQAAGYTLVDLSDDWTPFIFAEHRDANGHVLHNRYRRVFIGLANDQLDEDGQPLAPGEKNYLELYGIPPSLSVVRARLLADVNQPCHDETTQQALAAVESVAYIPPERMRAEDTKMARLKTELDKARRAAKVASLEELAARDSESAAKVKLLQKRQADEAAVAAVESRLACEGFLEAKSGHKKGVYDDALRLAVKRFQQKHMIYESNYLRKGTVEALGRSTAENDVLSLRRVLRERVVDAAAVLEDGSADTSKGPPRFLTAANEKAPVPNLADDLTDLVVKTLGVDTLEGAVAFFRRHESFAPLQAAVRLPAKPDYHGPHMDLSIVIDRGDVWYDLPFDEEGKAVPQPRKKFPTFTVFVKHRGQNVPLIRWRTTIGGWRAEQASDGYEYYRYKGSDVGPRVIRNIVAGPVWIAPESTPIRALVKSKRVFGRAQPAVNYDELGPGFLSAYGLVAGYFVVPGKDGRPDWDNGIRAHGSSEYLSMYSPTGFSHGCHRLPNHLAIRLYSFILRHRNMRVVGDQTMDFARQFLKGDEVYEMRLPSRGFGYQLDPPLPVEVLEGEIKGEQKTPILTYVPKPTVVYPGPPPALPNSPEARAGGAAAPAEASAKGKKASSTSAAVEEGEDI